MTHNAQPTRGAHAAAAANAPTNSAARERSKSLSLDLSLVARRAREACSLTQEELAAQIETRPQLVGEQENPHRPHLPRLDHVAHAPVEYRRVVVRTLAAIDGDILHERVDVVHGSHLARHASLTAEACDVLRAFSAAIADGSIDARERAAILPELRQLRAALDEAEAALLADERMGAR